MNFSRIYTLTTQPYLDTYTQCYTNIITINLIPEGPLKYFVRRVNIVPLSPFQQPIACSTYNKCALALYSFTNCNRYMTPDEIPDLFAFLTENGYGIDTSVTKMMNTGDVKLTNRNLLCFIKYLQNEKN
jgi:hypothetical protein